MSETKDSDAATVSPPDQRVLTPEDHESFLTDGYLLVRNVVSPEAIEKAVAFLESGNPEGDVGGANYKPLKSDVVADCVTDTVLKALEELLGDDYPIKRNRGAVDMPRPYIGRLHHS